MINFIKRLHNKKIEQRIERCEDRREDAALNISKYNIRISNHNQEIKTLELERDQYLFNMEHWDTERGKLEDKLW